jgi:hypothetical protein
MADKLGDLQEMYEASISLHLFDGDALCLNPISKTPKRKCPNVDQKKAEGSKHKFSKLQYIHRKTY